VFSSKFVAELVPNCSRLREGSWNAVGREGEAGTEAGILALDQGLSVHARRKNFGQKIFPLSVNLLCHVKVLTSSDSLN
jgi:hypothetical protein